MATAVESLLDMGFGPKERVEQALAAAKGNIEQAIVKLTSPDWQGDSSGGAADPRAEGAPAPAAPATSATATAAGEVGAAEAGSGAATSVGIAPGQTTVKSYKCNETGKLFRTMADVQMYSERTGRTDFSECTEEVKQRTKEEIEEVRKALLEKAKLKRAERERAEKERKREAERKRRREGQSQGNIREEMLALERKRQAEARRKEKKLQQMERERLRRELAKDKAERRARGGKLSGKLSIEGYNPAGQNTAAQVEERRALLRSAGVLKGPEPEISREERLAKSLKALGILRARNAGKIALTTVAKMLSRIQQKPEEEKYRTVNLLNENFKKRVTSNPGGKSLLIAAGFTENVEEQKIHLARDAIDQEWLAHVQVKIQETVSTLA